MWLQETWDDIRDMVRAAREGVRDNIRELREAAADNKADYRSLVAKLAGQRKLLEQLGAAGAERAQTGVDSWEQTSIGDRPAVVRYCRDGVVGRIDIWYHPIICVGQILLSAEVPYLTDAHAVVRHGRLTEWWLIEEDGRARVDGMRELTSEQAMRSALAVLWREESVVRRRHALSAFGDLLPSDRGALRKALKAAVQAGGHDNGTAERDKHIERLLDVLQAAIDEHREFDRVFAEADRVGMAVSQQRLAGYRMLPGYYARITFKTEDPNYFRAFYSGDGGVPFGEHQGVIEFRGNSVAQWLLLGGTVSHLRVI